MTKLFALLGLALAPATYAAAQVKLPAFITDSMVLQQATNAPIWGWSAPGQTVSVSSSWSPKVVSGVAGKDGKWMVKLPTPKAGGPYEVTIKASETKTLHGVLVGEVWICSGQSNMEMPLQGWPPGGPIQNSAGEIADANYPSIRMFTVEKAVGFAPKDEVKGSWATCSPATAGSYSATAYFFARQLYQQLHVPIGLIHTSWGGTIAEAWTSAPALRGIQDFNKDLDRLDSVRHNMKGMQLQDSLNEASWQRALADRSADYNAPSLKWATMQVPGYWESLGQPTLDGIVWFKRSVDVPADWAGKDLQLDLGPIDDRDITYFNGQAIDSTMKGFTWMADRHYHIPGSLVKAGNNSIVIKVIDDGGNGGLYGKPSQLALYPAGQQANSIALGGAWQYSIASVKPQPAVGTSPNQPSVLYNAMIAPLVPYAIKGAIWYQGESNVGRAEQYTRLFPTMIKDWRSRWQQGNFPFYFVQIAPYGYGGDSTQAAALRDAQRRTLKLAPNTGMAVTMDIGDNGNIHPADKQDVGKRLSLWALNKDYKQTKIVYSGPLYSGFAVKGNEVEVSFTNTDGGLSIVGEKLNDFELQDADGSWKPAQAALSGDKVTVSSDGVKAPKGVRYAYYAKAQGTLFNGKGLPASSFTSEALK